MLNSIRASLQEANKLDQIVEKHTLIVNEKQETEGALYFIPVRKNVVKVLIPAPFHKDLSAEHNLPTYRQLLKHKEIIVLK